MYRIIGADGGQYGPVDLAQIRIWIAQNRVNGYTLAQAEGSSEWKPMLSFVELAPEFRIAPVPMTAPGSDPGASNKSGIMRLKKFLRVLLVTDVIIIIFIIIAPTPETNDVSSGTALQFAYVAVMAIASLVARIGLFFFWRPARPILLAAIVIDILASGPILGVTNVSTLVDSLSNTEQCIEGFILAMIYFSPIRDLFEKPKGQS